MPARCPHADADLKFKSGVQSQVWARDLIGGNIHIWVVFKHKGTCDCLEEREEREERRPKALSQPHIVEVREMQRAGPARQDTGVRWGENPERRVPWKTE